MMIKTEKLSKRSSFLVNLYNTEKSFARFTTDENSSFSHCQRTGGSGARPHRVSFRVKTIGTRVVWPIGAKLVRGFSRAKEIYAFSVMPES